jgi:hypothetical protein
MNERLQLELHRALEKLGAPPDVLAVVASIDDTMTAEECAEFLKSYNDTGTIWDEVHCSIGRPAAPRR